MVVRTTLDDNERALRFDVYRSVVLGRYISHWGMPQYRVTTRRESDSSFFETYSFPTASDKVIYHFATVGVAEQKNSLGQRHGCEYFMTLPEDLGGARIDEILGYLVDLAVHSVRHSNCTIPRVMEDSPLAPQTWKTRSVLIDEARGESEDLSSIDIGGSSVDVNWIIPIYQSEASLILAQGIEAFDDLEDASPFSLADIRRPSFVQPS